MTHFLMAVSIWEIFNIWKISLSPNSLHLLINKLLQTKIRNENQNKNNRSTTPTLQSLGQCCINGIRKNLENKEALCADLTHLSLRDTISQLIHIPHKKTVKTLSLNYTVQKLLDIHAKIYICESMCVYLYVYYFDWNL